MTDYEARLILQVRISRYDHAEDINKALEVAKAALEKRVAKKPVAKTDRYCDLIYQYYCPSCGRYFGQAGVHSAILFNKERHCQGKDCGQALDWED